MKQFDKITNTTELADLLKSLSKVSKGRVFIKEKFEKIKKLFLSDNRDIQFFEGTKKLFFNDDVGTQLNNFFDFIRTLKEIPEFEEEYAEYSYWADLYDQLKIPEYKKPNLSDIFKMADSELRKIRVSGEGKIVKDVVFSNILLSEDKKVRQEKSIVLQHVAKDTQYQFKSCGTSSLIIQAGDQIVKLGLGRRKFEVPYHPRIMMPYFRKKYNDESCLEVFNYGDVESADITDEKVLDVYKELEKAGIIWGDAKKENLLVLKKDNNLPDFIKSKEFNLFGFLEDSRFPTDNHISLKKGDIVVCDLDMLYVKDDPNCHFGDLDDIVEDYIMGNEICHKDTEYNIDKSDFR